MKGTIISAEGRRLVEAFPCGGGFVRLDLWIGKRAPLVRQFVILTEDEWRKLRRYPSRSSNSFRGGAPSR